MNLHYTCIGRLKGSFTILMCENNKISQSFATIHFTARSHNGDISFVEPVYLRRVSIASWYFTGSASMSSFTKGLRKIPTSLCSSENFHSLPEVVSMHRRNAYIVDLAWEFSGFCSSKYLIADSVPFPLYVFVA